MSQAELIVAMRAVVERDKYKLSWSLEQWQAHFAERSHACVTQQRALGIDPKTVGTQSRSRDTTGNRQLDEAFAVIADEADQKFFRRFTDRGAQEGIPA